MHLTFEGNNCPTLFKSSESTAFKESRNSEKGKYDINNAHSEYRVKNLPYISEQPCIPIDNKQSQGRACPARGLSMSYHHSLLSQVGVDVFLPVRDVVSGVVPPVQRTGAIGTPPILDIGVIMARNVGVVQHGTEATPELGVDELSHGLPPEVVVVEGVVLVEGVEVGGQFPRRGEVLHVYVGVGWSSGQVVLPPSSHHYGHNVSPERWKTGVNRCLNMENR